MAFRADFLRTVVIASASIVVSSVQAQEQAKPAEATELPPLEVTAKQQKAAKKPAVKKSSPAPQASAPAPAAAPEPPRGASPGTGPVNGYAAKETTTGIKTDTPLREVPQSVSVIGAEQIRDQGAQSVQDALRYVPGVVADAYGNDSRNDGSFIRGTDPSEFLDGLRHNFNYYAFKYRIEPYFMERVEVLRGPSSVLYGQSAVGGLINAVSKLPQDKQAGEIGVEYGTFDFKQVKFDTTGLVTSDGKWSYRLSGLARDSETQVDFVDDDRYALQPAITYRPTNDTSITVLGNLQKRPVRLDFAVPSHCRDAVSELQRAHHSTRSFCRRAERSLRYRCRVRYADRRSPLRSDVQDPPHLALRRH